MSFLPTGNRLVRTTATVLLTGALVATTGMAAQAREVGDPFGHLDSATAVEGGVQVRGWAWDPSRSDATSVRLEIGSSTTTLVADEKRSDVADVHPSAGTNRGFEATVQAPAGTHEVCATAVNEGWGSDKALGCTTVTVAGSGSDDQSAGQGGKRGAHNTGVPAGTDLTVHEGDLTITEDGTVVEGLDVRGFITVRAKDVVIRDSIVRGRDTDSYKGLVVADTDGGSVTIEDTELAPTKASPWIDGIRGWNITARRVNVHDVIDAVHIYGPNVTIEDSWLHDNAHFTNDPNWDGGPSHDDSIQIQVGKNILIRNNVVTGANGTGIQFTQDQGKVSDVTIEENWLDGGACTINFSEGDRGAFSGVVITENVFGRNTTHDDCAIIAPTATREKLTVEDNTYTDGEDVSVRKG